MYTYEDQKRLVIDTITTRQEVRDKLGNLISLALNADLKEEVMDLYQRLSRLQLYWSQSTSDSHVLEKLIQLPPDADPKERERLMRAVEEIRNNLLWF